MPSWRPQTTLSLLQERKANELLSIKLRHVTDNVCNQRVQTELLNTTVTKNDVTLHCCDGSVLWARRNTVDPLKVDSHIACRAHAAPMPFPCHAVHSFTHAMPRPCPAPTVACPS